QGNHLGMVRMNDHSTQHLVVVGNLAIAVLPRQAVLAVDLLRAEVFDAVERHQVVAFKEDVVLQNLAPLQLAEDVGEQGAKQQRVDLVEDLAQLRVAGDGLQAEDAAQVVIDGPATEGEQGRVLEGEQGQSGQQGVGQGVVGLTALLGDLLEALPRQSHQSVKV